MTDPDRTIWVPPVLNFTIAVQRRIKGAPVGATFVFRSDEMRAIGEEEAGRLGRPDLAFTVGEQPS